MTLGSPLSFLFHNFFLLYFHIFSNKKVQSNFSKSFLNKRVQMEIGLVFKTNLDSGVIRQAVIYSQQPYNFCQALACKRVAESLAN